MASIMCRRSAPEPATGLSFTKPLIPHIEPDPRLEVASQSSCSKRHNENGAASVAGADRWCRDGHRDAAQPAQNLEYPLAPHWPTLLTVREPDESRPLRRRTSPKCGYTQRSGRKFQRTRLLTNKSDNAHRREWPDR